MSEERHFVDLVETGVVATVPDHKFVVDLVVDAALALFDEKMVVEAVRRGAVDARRVQVDRAVDGGRANLEPVVVAVPVLFDHPAKMFGNHSFSGRSPKRCFAVRTPLRKRRRGGANRRVGLGVSPVA